MSATVPVVGAGLLHLRALLVGGERQHEDARVVLAGGVDHRGERAEAEVGAGGHGVDGQRRGRVEVGVGVGLAGGADVTALHVEQHQGAGLAAGGDEPLEHGDASAAEPLVERRLRLDHRHPRCQQLTGREREALEAGEVVVEPPVVQQPGVGVDAGAQRATAQRRRRADGLRRWSRAVLSTSAGLSRTTRAPSGRAGATAGRRRRSRCRPAPASAPAWRRSRTSCALETPPTEMIVMPGSRERSRRSTSTERCRRTGPDSPPAPSAATSPAGVTSPSREIVVLVAIRPSSPRSRASSAMATTSSSARSGAIFTHSGHGPAGRVVGHAAYLVDQGGEPVDGLEGAQARACSARRR